MRSLYRENDDPHDGQVPAACKPERNARASVHSSREASQTLSTRPLLYAHSNSWMAKSDHWSGIVLAGLLREI